METDPTTRNPSTTETSRQRESFGLICILKIAAAASVQISKETQRAYLDVLIELPPESLREATHRTIREWDKPHMMPPPKFILDRAQVNAQVQAEAAWETVQRLVFKVWHPDVGWPGGVKPDIDPAAEYAIRQVGGMRKIHDVKIDEIQFVRKNFVEAFTRYTVEGGAQVALSEKQAVQILGGIQKALSEQREQRSLPPAPREASGFVQIAIEAKPITKRQAKPPQSAEEYKQRLALLRKQREELNAQQEKTA